MTVGLGKPAGRECERGAFRARKAPRQGLVSAGAFAYLIVERNDRQASVVKVSMGPVRSRGVADQHDPGCGYFYAFPAVVA